jgi:uncharacterized protein YndB with AHSA1/START domain
MTMKWIKRFVLGLAGLVALLAVVGLFLPAAVHVERGIVIEAPPEAVYPHVSDLRAFNAWSPWARSDPDTRYIFEGPPSGVGARMTWSSDDPHVGSGSQEIVAAEPNQRLDVRLDFGDQGTATAYYLLLARDGVTEVTWGFDTVFGYDLVGRYFGLLFDRWIGADYEQGLMNLKAVVESGP